MASIMNLWDRLENNAKIGVVIGISLIFLFAIGIGLWAYRSDYQVLFANLAPRDAAAMTAELDRMKIPYQLADGGNTITVAKDDVYRTRLKLMGNDIPLQGAVGFEVFNNADFGMTEFVQKVNYQRAIQGELTRTILSIEEIQSARVHLALPEQGLFKKSSTKPKASVTLAMKPGRVLAPDQVAGIQRLVAASVPDIVTADVTVLDQHGVALTKLATAEGVIESASTQLDSKRMTEDYLLHKVNRVLEKTLGAGEAVATVDVALNLDQSRITTEEVLPAKANGSESVTTGVVVRERQSTREGAANLTGDTTNSIKGAQPGATSTIESDYQVGKRVEQVVTASGALKRMTVAVVVKRPINDSQMQKIREVIGSVVGINNQRGDSIVVYSVDQLAGLTSSQTSRDAITAAEAIDTDSATLTQNESTKAGMHRESTFELWMLLLVALGVALAVMLYLLVRRSRSKPLRLSQHERERMLANVHLWIQGNHTPDGMGQTK